MNAGSKIDEILSDIEDAPSGPQIGAIFDYDGTLISGFSATAFLREQLMSGAMSPRDIRDQFTAIAKFITRRSGFSALMEATGGSLRGRSEEWFAEFGETVYRKSIAGSVYPESREIVKAHQAKGHTVAIISSATKYQIDPVARDLDIDHVLCTEMEVENGVFTGNVIKPTCFGDGKRLAAEKLAKETGFDLFETFFYTDSDDDLELLEAVGRQRVLNPNKRLDAIAHRRNWRTYNFSSRGRPELQTIMRTAMAYGAMPATFALTLPIMAFGGSKREMLNAATGIWADYASAITGLKLDIKGEENLWAERPAVFVFNHQSSADALIIPKLLRRDFTSIGKKEIARFPVIGQLMKFADVIFVDRKNSRKAIEAMQPVVDAIRNDGLSVAISPEGTRSISTKLGAFKKGPFHIAMQAGAPMVPIVIHNALDAIPKGHNISRPSTVHITVLPPVDTSAWKPETIDQHIEDVRGLFLAGLDQHTPQDDSKMSLDHWDDYQDPAKNAAE